MVLDRFARVDTDPNAQGLGRVGVVSGKSPLDVGGGAHRVLYLVKGGHDAVAGMLDLAPAVRLKPASDQCVMRPHEFKRCAVAETRCHLRDNVGEHDCPQPGVHGGHRCARGRAWIADAAEERLDGSQIDRNDGVGDFPMRLTMDQRGGGGVWDMDEAERGAIVLVEPIGHVFYAVSTLYVDIPAVRPGDIIRLQPAQVMTVHENRHEISHGQRGGSHCAAAVIFAGSGFDLRLAFDGCARDDHFGKARL
jgi:hypothetical protein